MFFKNEHTILFATLIILIILCLLGDSFKIENYGDFKVSDIKTEYNNLIKKKRNGESHESIIFNDYSEKIIKQNKGLENIEKILNSMENKLHTLQNPPVKYIGTPEKKSKYIYNDEHY